MADFFLLCPLVGVYIDIELFTIQYEKPADFNHGNHSITCYLIYYLFICLILAISSKAIKSICSCLLLYKVFREKKWRYNTFYVLNSSAAFQNLFKTCSHNKRKSENGSHCGKSGAHENDFFTPSLHCIVRT